MFLPLPPGGTRISAHRCHAPAQAHQKKGYGGEAPENKKKERLLPLLLNISLPRLGLAVQAAVDPALPVGELEDLGQLLLHGGDAPGVFAVDHVGDGLRQL